MQLSTEAAAAEFRPIRVLVADDNRDQTTILCDLLNLHGYEALGANDGESAIAMISKDRPDVVVLDLSMPPSGGNSVAKWLRAQPGGKCVTLIALTGWTRKSDFEQAMASGFDHFLVKPTGTATLLSLLAGLRAVRGTASLPA